MGALDDIARAVTGARSLRLRSGAHAPVVLFALALALVAAGCGGDVRSATPATTGSRPMPATTATPPAPTTSPRAGVDGPPKSTDGVCERTTADRKSLPSWARITVKRFVAAVDAGDRATLRALFDPAGADEALADLRPVARLGLLALEDRY